MNSLARVSLGEVSKLNPTFRAKEVAPDELVDFLPMSAVCAELTTACAAEQRPFSEVQKGYTNFADGDVLLAKITPCFENGKIAFAKVTTEFGFGSTEFHVIRADPERLDGRYLVHFLRRDEIRVDGARNMTGSAGQRRVPKHYLESLSIPLPPLAAQRRIAAILDQVDALRAKRREALAQLDSLTQSIFIKMFGDPASNPMKWPSVQLKSILAMPLRNGLSPSNAGSVFAKVLTLSAITGSAFDASAWKTSTFHSAPPAHQSVDSQDFLICRGNGNVRLVGKGYFPGDSTTDVTFPDTMIAARITQDSVAREYLQHVWQSNTVRKQIEAAARTTNGTFKVNQTMLEELTFMLPPLGPQNIFANRIQAVEALKAKHHAALQELNRLFASLQHRAFQGEL